MTDKWIPQLEIPQREGGANSLKYPSLLGSYRLGDRNNQKILQISQTLKQAFR